MIAELLYRLKRIFHFFKTGMGEGLIWSLRTGFPQRKLKIICITGTDGKTTSSTLLYHALNTAGKKVALVSTVAAYIGDEQLDTGFHVTSPSPRQVFQFMKKMVKENYEYLVLETTSHGIYQYRTWGIKPYIAGLTNISPEHLDYHLTYANYVEAKALLLKKATHTVINADDASYSFVKRHLRNHKHLITYSLSDRISPQVAATMKQRFTEEYNVLNARLVYAICQQLGIDTGSFKQALLSFSGIPGRMEEIQNKRHFRVVVDFAHTPQALEAALKTLRSQLRHSGRLIAVFGCAGLRDKHKRPVMGKIGVSIADLAVFTAEDPRTEDIWSILRQMKEQLEEGHNRVITIPDRKAAIEFALNNLAKRGDIVGIFGKGHEQSMCIGTTEYPWDDRRIAREILNARSST